MNEIMNFYEKYIHYANLNFPVFKTKIEEVTNKEKKNIQLIKGRDRSNTYFEKNIGFNYKNSEDKSMNIPKNNPLANIGKHFNKFDLFNK